MDTVLYRKETARGISVSLDSVSAESIDQVVKLWRKLREYSFTGAGRSFLMIQAMAMAMMQIGVTAYVTGGVTTPAIEEGDLLIGASCSGETKSVALFHGAGQKQGAKVTLITARPDSTMGKIADIVIQMEARPEKREAFRRHGSQ